MKAVVFTVTHPGNDRYLTEFLRSLERQTDQDFDLLVVDDVMTGNDRGIAHRLGQTSLRWEVLPMVGSPAAIRKYSLEVLRRRPPCSIIFIDSDDLMAPNRVASVRRDLRKNEILFNDLRLFGDSIAEPRRLLSRRWPDGAILGLDDLVHGNCLGLSNTAIFNTDLNDRFNSIPEDMIAFDWALFAGLVFDGRVPRFCAATHTDYRQHPNNSASLTAADDDRIRLTIRVKIQYYRYMSDVCPAFDQWKIGFERLLTRVTEDASFSRHYFAAMRADVPSDLWWESVKIWGDSSEDWGN